VAGVASVGAGNHDCVHYRKRPPDDFPDLGAAPLCLGFVNVSSH